ncbi:MAG: putative Rieske iron-sulfur protein [Pseudomonas sp.]|uniref:Rieske (2Fe-2S) protein n=1 Tax=Pseudomonas sp. TaxID=306 RepID=UPI00261DD481|nr:Rieske 2Fe-2S domain-containing protein [Pseudomonas sp.]MDB6051829.1 putative Rieske iron-sulfur protein [Pseudomonas sp.]
MFFPLERLINLHEGYRQTFKVAGRNLLLMVVDNQPLLLEDSCPHQGAPLRTATLMGTVLRCQRHGMEFQLPSGRASQPSCPSLKMFGLVYDGASIGVDV